MITSWSHWSVGRRIGCAFLVVVLGMGLLTALGVQRVGGISDRLTTINDLNSVKQRYAINFRGSVHDRAIAVRDVVLASDASQVDEEVDRIAALTAKYSASEVKLTALFAEPGAVNDRERAARADIDAVQTATLPLIEQVVATKRAGDDAAALELLVSKAKPQFVEWLRTINVLIDLEEAQNKVESDAARGIASSFLPLMLLVGLGAAALAALVAWRTTRSVTRPLGEAAEVMAEVARGDLRRRIQVRGDDEVARVARSTNSALDTLSEVIGTIRTSAQSLSSSSGTLTSLTGAIADSADDAAARADVVSTAADDVSRNVQVVATGADEMGLSIRQIAQNANEAARVAGAAVRTAHETNDTVGKLGVSSREIGDVVKVITSIAEQTNLLALNATIEAARAGDSGKGFAVVANEVKELAQATARATDDISRRIEAIQADTAGAVAAIGRIGDVIGEINDYQTVIAAAVEEQTSTTNEMSRSVGDAAHGTAQIASNVGGVAAAASATRACVEDSRNATRAVGELSAELRGLVEHFTL